MTLASIDADDRSHGAVQPAAQPRGGAVRAGSTAAAPCPGWPCGDACLLNAVYTWGAGHAALFPGVRDPGAEAMKEAVAGVPGCRWTTTCSSTSQGFRQLIDAMGGVTVTVRSAGADRRGTSAGQGVHPSRARSTSTATTRCGRAFPARRRRLRAHATAAVRMNAMLHQLDPAGVLAHFEDIAAAGSRVVRHRPAERRARALRGAGRQGALGAADERALRAAAARARAPRLRGAGEGGRHAADGRRHARPWPAPAPSAPQPPTSPAPASPTPGRRPRRWPRRRRCQARRCSATDLVPSRGVALHRTRAMPAAAAALGRRAPPLLGTIADTTRTLKIRSAAMIVVVVASIHGEIGVINDGSRDQREGAGRRRGPGCPGAGS